MSQWKKIDTWNKKKNFYFINKNKKKKKGKGKRERENIGTCIYLERKKNIIG
jgi:hypothetical protein